ncbi:MAG: IS1 family transposase [Candidatus Electrothrix sp. EH2]|nr:IS1 family transposase [Candidatus Electrothrix sp. EH2]
MKQYIEIRCRHCGADDLVKNGRSENGTQRYRCNECGKSFQNVNTVITHGNPESRSRLGAEVQPLCSDEM